MSQRQTITVFEDRQAKLDLSESQIRDILSLKDILGSQNIILQADGTLRIQRYVGYIVKNQTSIQILPKIFQDGNSPQDSEEEIESSTTLLFRLLAYSGFINIKELPEPQEVSKFNHDILELFISIFVRKFLKVFSTDPHRQYQPQTDNMQFIKGKVLFQETIRKNSFQRHLHYVAFDEFTLNNPLNRIFKTILLQLIRVTNIAENKANIKIALGMLGHVDQIALSPTVFKSINFNRLNQRYEPLFNLAKLFYYNYQPGFKDGDDNTLSFLVPLYKLFEKVVLTIVEDAVDRIDGSKLRVKYQRPQKYLGKSREGGVFQLQPDITILRRGKVEVILDAKYKNPISDGKVGINEGDIYQMLAYAVAYNCKEIYLVYPAFKNSRGGLATDEISDGDILLEEFFIGDEYKDIRIAVVQLDITKPDFTSLVEAIERELVDSEGSREELCIY